MLEILKGLRWKNILLLTIAGCINAFGVTIFLAPVELYDSGISGTSMLLSQITPSYLSLSVFLVVLNIPLFLFGLKKQGIYFTIYATYTVIIFFRIFFFIFYLIYVAVYVCWFNVLLWFTDIFQDNVSFLYPDIYTSVCTFAILLTHFIRFSFWSVLWHGSFLEKKKRLRQRANIGRHYILVFVHF